MEVSTVDGGSGGSCDATSPLHVSPAAAAAAVAPRAPYVLFPIQHPDVWELYKKQQMLYWTAEIVDLKRDITLWQELPPLERHFLTHVLAFFAAADGIINKNVCTNFYEEVDMPEARAFYAIQAAVETVHMEVYSQLVDTYVRDARERDRIFNAIETMPAVRAKAAWALQWMDRGHASLPERLLAFVAVEGIGFSGSFCAIFWMKARGKLPGLCFANELISRDEGLHCVFGMHVYRALHADALPEARVHAIFRSAVDNEVAFITEALPCELIGMNSRLMTQYVQAVANVLCVGVGVRPLYPGVSNPFAWMRLIDINGKTNFFERRVSEYVLHVNRDAGSASASCYTDTEF
jgi:ribonucleotide reductase beta subunit family protein with ferritin-like domain